MASFHEYGVEPLDTIKVRNVLTIWALSEEMEEQEKRKSVSDQFSAEKKIQYPTKLREKKWAILFLNMIKVFENA
jgi:hypothetical protein